jgi:hypothetical protein
MVDDDVEFEASVCPKPISSLRRQLARKTAFVYRGGGACRGCTRDNVDARRVLQILEFGSSAWFESIYAVFLEIKIKSLIQLLVAPRYLNCLGLLPRVHVEINKVSLSELQTNLLCQTGTISPLSSPRNQSIVGQTQDCSTCRSINFSESSNGEKVFNGIEISQEWKSIGVSIFAASYPSTSQSSLKPRVFDTTNSTCILSTKMQNLGSPNKLCPGGGLGDGEAGGPGQLGENCNALGSKFLTIGNKSKTKC